MVAYSKNRSYYKGTSETLCDSGSKSHCRVCEMRTAQVCSERPETFSILLFRQRSADEEGVLADRSRRLKNERDESPMRCLCKYHRCVVMLFGFV